MQTIPCSVQLDISKLYIRRAYPITHALQLLFYNYTCSTLYSSIMDDGRSYTSDIDLAFLPYTVYVVMTCVDYANVCHTHKGHTYLVYNDIHSFLALPLRARNFGGLTADWKTPRLPPLVVAHTFFVTVTHPWLLGFR
jgi:hypothetical protein